MVFIGNSDGEEPTVSCGCGDDKEVTVEGWKVVLFWLEASVVGWEEVIISEGVICLAVEELFS